MGNRFTCSKQQEVVEAAAKNMMNAQSEDNHAKNSSGNENVVLQDKSPNAMDTSTKTNKATKQVNTISGSEQQNPVITNTPSNTTATPSVQAQNPNSRTSYTYTWNCKKCGYEECTPFTKLDLTTISMHELQEFLKSYPLQKKRTSSVETANENAVGTENLDKMSVGGNKEGVENQKDLLLKTVLCPTCGFSEELATIQQMKYIIRYLYYDICGFACIQNADKAKAESERCDLLYGEVRPEGLVRVMDCAHLNSQNASVVFDLGCGVGKLALQVFLQYPNIKKIVGVELAPSRFAQAAIALERLVPSRASGSKSNGCEIYESPVTSHHPADDFELRMLQNCEIALSKSSSDRSIALKTVRSGDGNGNNQEQKANGHYERILEFREANMFNVKDVSEADIVFCETMVPAEQFDNYHKLLGQLKPGCRLLTFSNLDQIFGSWKYQSQGVCWRQLEINKPKADSFLTSWNSNGGHHFFIWDIVPPYYPPKPTEDPFAEKKAKLRGMGFGDEQLLDEYLHATNGEVMTTVEWMTKPIARRGR